MSLQQGPWAGPPRKSCLVPLDRGPGLGREVGRNRMARSARSSSQWKALMPSVGNGEAIQALDRRLQSRARGKHKRKGEGSTRTPVSVATAPWPGKAWDGDSCCLLVLAPPPHVFPLLLPSCLSLLQVRSSLGTNILSAMAAFAGTAILLMDFGVTNWVRCQMPPVSGETWRSADANPGAGVGESLQHQEARALGTGRACRSQ